MSSNRLKNWNVREHTKFKEVNMDYLCNINVVIDKVETRLRTFLEFTFAHIYHLRTKKYYACALLEINVCPHF
jgi:hypothetical protein